MSTEREVGPTGPQGEQPAGAQEAAGAASDSTAQGGHKPTMAFSRVPQPAAEPAAGASAADEAPADGAPVDGAPAAEGGHKPTMAFSRVPQPVAEPGAPEAAPAEGGHKPTVAFTKVPAPEAPAAPAVEEPAVDPVTGYIDAPPPVLPPAPPVAPAPAAPAPAVAVQAAAPAAPAVPPGTNPYATPTHGVPAAGVPDTYGVPAANAQDPYGVPAANAQEPYGAPGAGGPAPHGHHPFGAGQPLGGWGAHDATSGGAGHPGGPNGPLGYPADYPGGPGGPGGPRKKRGGLVALLAAVALVAGVAGGAIGVVATGHNNSSSSADDHRSTTVQASNTQKNEPAPGSIASIAQKALPSVVTIKAQGSQESGTGTGFVFDTEGHILTNNHVVAPTLNGGKLTVKFADGTSYSASVLGHAEGYDVAVVKIDNPPKAKLAPLALADSDKVNVGDATIAIGAPYGLESTVTSGIVSAKDRPVASGDETGSQASYMNALQTDASINPGNSGGPLLDSSGAVIGINSAIQSNASANGRAGSIGLGFAIPINQAKWVADTLIKTGKPVYAKLDVLRNDDYKGDGAQIQTRDVQGQPAVTPGGAADKAGLKPGDVITKLGGAPIENGPALVSRIWTHKPGETVDVEYTRNGQTMTTKVTLGQRDGDQ
ncbi:trypsin-like peptidase domain-containing protein [Kitasatospora aureofaciens]|uniref:S1C family serine protease n=1 Tax=Kitasatospora aureofaciens TaxID=1894 RepID=UPI001D8A1032|nr:trypsin-like peptidase domain-containing protein [Kitasatospora aureofaciens]HJD80817.1 trypsin-like peptidase domain-containing protein [Kitasatospora aureofaciens]